ncbi:MAG: hypothetical protein R3228_14995, partial [Halioglobus sp.]|nr:hypothetical protein [Halioglobus sp.]
RAFPEIDLTELVSDEHGVEAAAAFDALFGGIQYSWRGESQDQYDEFVSRYQIFSSFVANASGIVVHSEYTRERVVRSYDGPVARLHLPFEPAPTWQTRRSGQPPYTILFCGHAGPNRRLLPFIETWARVSRPEMFRLSLYGNIGKVDEIMSFAADHGVAQYIELVGYVNEETLHEACLEADLALNLRYPTVGEASGSQLRFWSASLPAIVSDIGWYSELPDDVVLKVTPGDEGAGVARVLESFIDGQERYVDVGEKGYRYLCDKHSPAAYADDLYDFVAQISTQRFRQSALEGRFIDVLASMCEDVHDSHLFEATLAKLSSMVENLDSPNSDHQ